VRRNPIVSRQFTEAGTARESSFSVPKVSVKDFGAGMLFSSFDIALRTSSAAVLI
jgi:hypothetical protein